MLSKNRNGDAVARAEENLSRSEAQNKHHEELITMKRSEGKRIDRLAFCIRSLLA